MLAQAGNKGQVAPGVKFIQYCGTSIIHSLPSPHGLVIQPSFKELILTKHDGCQQILPISHGSWYPRKDGIAIQNGSKYFLVSYDGCDSKLIYRNVANDHIRCCSTGIILNQSSGFLYVPFDNSGFRSFWKDKGMHAVVDDGIVIGSYEKRNWTHVSVFGESNVIYTDPDRWRDYTGISSHGNVWVHGKDEELLYHWDGREPAVTKYAGCGGCSEGIVANFKDKIVIYRFGGGELVLWEGPYDEWHGSCNEGLFILKDDDVLFLPYEGGRPKILWSGPFRELCSFDSALLVRNDQEVVMIPLPQ